MKPHQNFRAPAGPRRAPSRLTRLALGLALLPAALCLARADADAQDGRQGVSGPAPAPTPYVRPRTVGPKVEARPAPAEQPDAAPAAPEEIDEDEVVRVETNLVLIPASVVDARGRAVVDLRLEDFELKVDGEMKPISDLSRAETPVNIALLFDNSQSLSAAREFEKQAALRFFRSVVRPIDRAAIYSISTQPKLEHNFTNNVPVLVRTIENFGPPAGATALFDTIAQAADHIRPYAGRKVLVLVSDGSDTLSDINFDEALNRSLRSECQIYVVQTRQIEDPNLHDRISEEAMRKLSEQTGGALFAPRTLEDLDAAFAQISLDLAQQYVLGYNPQGERRDNYFRFINVSVKTRPHLRVRARKGFYPNGAQPGAAEPPADAARRPAQQLASAAPDAAPARKAKSKPASRPTARARGERAGRVGPAGPDEEERARPAAAPAQESEESHPSVTLTVADSAPASYPTPAPADYAAAATTPPPAPAPRPTPTPAELAAAPAPTPAAEKKEELKGTPLSGGVLNSRALDLPRPSYPPTARNAGVFGTVTVEVMIDERGRVSEARVVSGHPLLHHAAVSAARLAKFSPTVLSGEPVKVKGTINYNFTRQ